MTKPIKGRLTLVTAPTVEPITTAEAKSFARVDHSTDDTLIGTLITAARRFVETHTRRAMVQQTWDYKMDAFPGSNDAVILLPKPPLQSISQITYTDNNGDAQTWAATNYIVDAPAGDTPAPGRLALAYDKSWPETRDIINAVAIRLVAGYADSGASPADLADRVPEDLKLLHKILVRHWYDDRGPVAATTINDLPFHARALLGHFTLYEF